MPVVPEHAHILRSILAPSSSVVTGDGVHNIAVLAGDGLLDPPGLSKILIKRVASSVCYKGGKSIISSVRNLMSILLF